MLTCNIIFRISHFNMAAHLCEMVTEPNAVCTHSLNVSTIQTIPPPHCSQSTRNMRSRHLLWVQKISQSAASKREREREPFDSRKLISIR